MPWKALFMPARHMSRDMFTCEYFDCNDAFGHGAFQKRLMMLCALGAFLANIHALAFPLISKSVQYRCKQPYANDSKAFGKNGAARDDSGQIGECLVYEDPADPNDTQTVPCVEWEYDEDRAKSTAVSTWNMVCGRKPLIVVMYAIQNTWSRRVRLDSRVFRGQLRPSACAVDSDCGANNLDGSGLRVS
ncbi:hypothetical protein MRX96_020092 [Rhipicephalus microplus]